MVWQVILPWSDCRAGCAHQRWRAQPILLLTTLFVVGCSSDKPELKPIPPTDPRSSGGPAAAADIDWPRVLELRNRGNGHLENGTLPEATDDLSELCRMLPQEPLGFRNRMIASLLALEGINRSTQAGEFAAAVRVARQHLKELQAVEPDAATTRVLAGRLAATEDDVEAAAASLEAALQLRPDDGALWYELFEVTRHETSEANLARSRSALSQAHSHAPDNLFVLIEYLQAQATRHASSMSEALQTARQTLAPLAAGIEQRVRVNPLDLLDQAETALESGDWRGVERSVRIIANITRPDDAVQSDRARIEQHLLEFMLIDFAFVTLPEDVTQSPQEPAMAFAPAGSNAALPTLENVWDALFADFDLDGRDEYITLSDDDVTVYRRDSDAETWRELTSVEVSADVWRLIAVDLDQDVVESPPPADAPEGQLPEVCHAADVDIVLFGTDGLILLENVDEDGMRRLQPRDLPVELAALENIRALVAADLNSDGDLDLVTASEPGLSWWSNRGGFDFSPGQLPNELPSMVTALTSVDLDRDVDLDVVVGCESGEVGYLENLRHGTFRYRPIDSESSDSDPEITAIDVGDVDSDASWDVVASSDTGVRTWMSRWIEPGEVQFEPVSTLAETPALGFVLGDFNNSGTLDLTRWNGEGLSVASGAGDGTIDLLREAVDTGLSGDITHVRSNDFDADGDLDLLVIGDGEADLLLNDAASTGIWLRVGLLAQQVKGTQSAVSGRVNHYGLGSLLEIRAGGRYQARVVRGATTHFGLGESEQADTLRIVWTNGIPDNVIAPQPRQYRCEHQALKGSCPYLYTWNGEEFEFVTDLLWASPIGLVNPQGDLVPCREWEYLLVPGEALAETDGEYRLSITEELWEAAYFDLVELIAVDHPADVNVFTNEKVGPPSLAEHRLYTVRARRHPTAVVDGHGRDLLELISAADDQYAAPFQSKQTQGYTEDSWLQIDLGLTKPPERLTLFLTGWVYPTDTSINAALEERDDLSGPRPPSIEVPDGNGGWREAIPFIGFPGGKTKTIAVELPSELFEDGDSRLRLATSMELYWDEIFFTVDEPAADTREQALPLLAADLRQRGVSAVVEHPQLGPERYDYSQVRTAPAWPPMRGYFTRYGDVTELIVDADDRIVVLGSGDELLVRFATPPEPPPEGWTRDFVLHNVGWDKDADLHTVYGQTVEPLPFRRMSRYPYEPGESFPQSRLVEEYLRAYQTREYSPRRFGRLIQRNGTPP